MRKLNLEHISPTPQLAFKGKINYFRYMCFFSKWQTYLHWGTFSRSNRCTHKIRPPNDPGPRLKVPPRPQSPDGSAMHGGTNTGSESKSDCNKTQKHEWEALQWQAWCRTMGPTLNKRQIPGWAAGVWYRLQAPTPCLGNRGEGEKRTQYCNLTADVFI